MTTAASSAPLLFSVLTTSHDNSEDFVNQLRIHLSQIETNVQQTLNQIQQRKPYISLKTNTNKVDSNTRNNFFNVLRDVATRNNLPFDEPLFRRQILENENSSSVSKIDIVHIKPTSIDDTHDQHISPINNTRRSQFAPVLSSTPVHQTSPVTPIPINITMATPSVAPTSTINANDLPTVMPSAIVPQRAKVGRNGGRPPRIPRGESVTREKNNTSTIKEQQEEIILAKEIYITSKREINGRQGIIEDNIEIVIEQQPEIISNIIKQVQTTPLRGKTKKTTQDNVNIQPQIEPPVAICVPEIEVVPKKTRGGKNKKKEESKEQEVKSTRAPSVRNRNKKEDVIVPNEEVVIPQEEIPEPPKTTNRNKKDAILPKDENTMPSKRTARGKKEQVVPKEENLESSKRTTRNKKEEETVSKDEIPQSSKRTTKNKKGDEVTKDENPQPSKRTMRNKKEEEVVEKNENAPASKRTTRNKKEETVSKDAIAQSSKRTTKNKKQDDIVTKEDNPQSSTINKEEEIVSKDENPQPSKRGTRNKKEAVSKDEIPQPPKRTMRNKKLVEPTINVQPEPSIITVRATPSRNKQKPTLDITEPIILATPKKSITKSNKRKATEDVIDNPTDTIQPSSPKRRTARNTKSKNSSITENITMPTPIEPAVPKETKSTRSSRRGKTDIEIPIQKEETVSKKTTRITHGKKVKEVVNTDTSTAIVDVVMTSVTNITEKVPSSSVKSIVSKPPRPPIARKKKSIAMPPLSQTSPSTPPPITTQRIQSTSPVNDKPLLPLPIPMDGGRRRQQQDYDLMSTPPRVEKRLLETLPSDARNPKRTRSSVAATPKRIRRDDLVITTVPGTPGKKRNACTCQKRRNRKCDICATALED